jgi:phosphatidate phosphatase APP1
MEYEVSIKHKSEVLISKEVLSDHQSLGIISDIDDTVTVVSTHPVDTKKIYILLF